MKIEILNTKNFFTTYFIPNEKRACVVIAPGGGYCYTSERESGCIAKKYNEAGFHAVVVNYRETLDIHPAPMLQMAYTINYLREKFSNIVIPNQIAVLGFSAGGHVAASVAVHFSDIEGMNCRPDYLMLAYPVISSEEQYFHRKSFEMLLGENFVNSELREYLSLEKQINKNVPDTFIWHTVTDESVPAMNSMLFVKALMDQKVNVEFHIFPFGGHGLSLANEETANGDNEKVNPYIARWFEMSVEWLKYKISIQ